MMWPIRSLITRRHARRAGEQLLVAELDAFLAFVFNISKADQVGRDFAFRIEALVFVARINAGDVQRGDFRAMSSGTWRFT